MLFFCCQCLRAASKNKQKTSKTMKPKNKINQSMGTGAGYKKKLKIKVISDGARCYITQENRAASPLNFRAASRQWRSTRSDWKPVAIHRGARGAVSLLNDDHRAAVVQLVTVRCAVLDFRAANAALVGDGGAEFDRSSAADLGVTVYPAAGCESTARPVVNDEQRGLEYRRAWYGQSPPSGAGGAVLARAGVSLGVTVSPLLAAVGKRAEMGADKWVRGSADMSAAAKGKIGSVAGADDIGAYYDRQRDEARGIWRGVTLGGADESGADIPAPSGVLAFAPTAGDRASHRHFQHAS